METFTRIEITIGNNSSGCPFSHGSLGRFPGPVIRSAKYRYIGTTDRIRDRGTRRCRSGRRPVTVVGFEKKSEVGGADARVGVESERFEDPAGALAGVLDVVLRDFHLDFDELPQAGHVVERDGVTVEFEPFAHLLDGLGRFEPETVEDPLDGEGAVDTGLVLLAGLRGVVDERSLVGNQHRLVVLGRLPAESERLVRLGEVPMGRVVIGVGLRDRPLGTGVAPAEVGPHHVVVGPDLDLDLVHTRTPWRPGKNCAVGGRCPPVIPRIRAPRKRCS